MTINMKIVGVCTEVGNHLLELMNIEANMLLSSQEDVIYVDIVGRQSGDLIGYHGETLSAFQTLLSFMISKKIGQRVGVIVDVDGYRQKQKSLLENIALRAAQSVRESSRSVSLEPMNPYERRMVHMFLQDEDGIRTESQGRDPYRKVVICPQPST